MRNSILLVLILGSLTVSAADKKNAKPKRGGKPAKAQKTVKKEYSNFPRLMTARELLAIGPVKRQEYFQNLRVMLNELDKQAFLKRGTLVSDVEAKADEKFVSKYEAVLDLLEGLIPSAAAAGCANPDYPFAVEGMCGSLCAGRPIRNDESGRAIGNVYFCFPRSDYDAWAARQSDPRRPMRISPEEYDALNFPGSWEEREPKLIEAQRLAAERAQALAEQRAAEARAAELRAREIERQRLAEAEIAESEERARQEAARAAEILKEQQRLGTQVTEGTRPLPEKGKGGGQCSPSQLSCTDRDQYLRTSQRGALKTFRSKNPVHCVSSGNMSRYANNEVKAGNCGVVREFCLRQEDCSKAPERRDNGFMSRYTCAANESICSPFIYGLETKEKAICVPQRGRHLTEACDTKASALKGKAGYVGDFLKEAPAGVSEAWDEYADGFNSTCKQKTESQDAHCLECGIIGRRLQESRALATGSCTDALSFQQMRPGSATPPATAQ